LRTWRWAVPQKLHDRSVGLALLDRALAGSHVHDLMDPLVAQPERVGDLPQGCTGCVEPADRVLVPDLGLVGLVLQVQRPVSRLPSLPENLVV